MYRCALCPLQSPTYETVEELEVHIAADHINHIPYECERCRFSKFPTEFALISHCTADHGLREFYVKYKVTPDFHRKRAKIKELLEHSVALSKIPFRCYKRRRMAESLAQQLGSGEPCSSSSLDSDEMVARMTEIEKEPKAESVKGSEVEPEDSTLEKDLEPMRPKSAAPQNRDQVNIADALSNIYVEEDCPAGAAAREPSGVADHSGSGLSVTANEAQSQQQQQQSKKRSRPPRTCNICGLQVTGQRSSLIYHANSKHLRLPMFFCLECKKTWTTVTKSDVLKHVKACHEGDESLIEDHRMQYVKDVHDITDKCFPPKSRGSYADDELESFASPEFWIKSEESGGGGFVGM